VRPAVVVQNDRLNAQLQTTMVAIVTSTTFRAAAESSQLLIDVGTSDGQQSGLLHNSVVKCEHVNTVDKRHILRKIGELSPALRLGLDVCLKAAMELP